jgi:hypothetical protein
MVWVVEGSPRAELVEYLRRTEGLEEGHAVRLVSEVLAYFSETTESFVRRRHKELQTHGLRNREIFERIGSELVDLRVRPPSLSERQIRRLLYG